MASSTEPEGKTEMDLHNLNIRLIEYKNIMWTCLSTRDPEEIHAELMSGRVSSGITHDAALVMGESLWIRWCKHDRFLKKFKQCSVGEYAARGVAGTWTAAHEGDPVVVLTDSNMHKQDRTISEMSFAFVHISQVKYPRQYDAPVKKAQ